MRPPLDAHQPVAKPVAPRAITFLASTVLSNFITLKHSQSCGRGLTPEQWDVQNDQFSSKDLVQ